MADVATDADFDRLSWHDCHIWGIEIRAGEPADDDWTSDLARFRVAPATLVFHGVTDPKIGIDWGASGFQAAIHPVSIAAVSRELIRDQKVYLDRPYYRWRIALNWPEGGAIEFGAVGFTQTLRAEPVVSDVQHLTRLLRRPASSAP